MKGIEPSTRSLGRLRCRVWDSFSANLSFKNTPNASKTSARYADILRTAATDGVGGLAHVTRVVMGVNTNQRLHRGREEARC